MSEDLIKKFNEADDDALLNRRITAAGLGVKISLLATKATRGGGPPFQQVGYNCMYKKSDALAWLKIYKATPRKTNHDHFWRHTPAC